MRRVFADTFYYLALLNPQNDAHTKAAEFTEQFPGRMLTTDWILTELADGLSREPSRAALVSFIEGQRADPAIRIVPASRSLFPAWLGPLSPSTGQGGVT